MGDLHELPQQIFRAGDLETPPREQPLRKPQHHLVPIELMAAVADTRVEGDVKYGVGNWMKGSKEFFVDCLGHAIEHLMLCAWDEEESIWTHLGHAATNIAFILWALKRGKVTRADFQNAATVASQAHSSGSSKNL
jgi:hypothetical protein